MENYELIRYENSIIKRVGNAISVTNKLLVTLNPKLLIPYRKKEKWGFCTPDKQIFMDCIYDNASLFHEDISIVERDHKKIIVSVSGKEICTDYDYISFYQEGFASISKGGKYTFINIKGEKLTDLIYDQVDLFYEGMASVKRNNKYGFIDIHGKEIIPCVHDNVGRFENGIGWVQINNRYVSSIKLAN